ncbi:MAG: hypothetical protein QXK37_06405 [Candidatus Woesearchaeota archaeon]
MNRGLFLSVFAAFCLLLTILSVHAQENRFLYFSVTETGKVISYYKEYFVIQVNGSVTMYNYYNNSLFNIIIPLDVGTLTIIETSNTNFLYPGKFYIPLIRSHETLYMEYQIFGILPYNFTEPGKGVFETALKIAERRADTVLNVNIQKAPIEYTTIDDGKIIGRAGRRLVSITVENPTILTHNITSISVIKTTDQNPNVEIVKWTFPEENDTQIQIGPMEKWHKDIVDLNASEGEVYWLSTDIVLLEMINYSFAKNILFLTEKDLYSPANNTLSEEETINLTSYLEHLLYFRKKTSKSVLIPGDEVRIDFQIHNFAPKQRNITLFEAYPSGFILLNASGGNVSARNITWKKDLNPDSALHFGYNLRFVDNETLGLDYFEPAVLHYENYTLYSERIPFVRQYIPQKRLFVQKKIRYSTNDEVVVQIQVQNLGEGEAQDIYVMEFLEEKDVFREMTSLPESKGVWKIPVLKTGELWEVSYVTDENKALTLLPQIFGVDEKVVLKTLVFENVVRNEWITSTIKRIEIIGIIFVLLFPPLVFVYFRRRKIKRELSLRGLEKEVQSLKKKTEPSTEQQLSVLERETKASSVIEPLEKGFSPPPPKRARLKEFAHENLERLKQIKQK